MMNNRNDDQIPMMINNKDEPTKLLEDKKLGSINKSYCVCALVFVFFIGYGCGRLTPLLLAFVK